MDDTFDILTEGHRPKGKQRTVGELRTLVCRCSYPGYTFKVGLDDSRCYIQIVCDGADTTTGEPMAWSGRKWMLSPFMTDTEVVQTCWAAVQRAILHEASELFRFDDAAIYDRHISVHRLVELTGRWDALDARESPHA
jgi:hypothetical protein